MSDRSLIRVLALDVRPRRFGFVVFEGPKHLLDWGVRSYTEAGAVFAKVAEKKIAELLNMFEPSIVVTRTPSTHSKEAARRARTVLRIVREQVSPRSVSFFQIDSQKVQRFFRLHGCTTKYQIATILAKWHADLEWKLPPKRELWQSEDYRMSMFDAAALGTAYFGQSEMR